MLFISVFLPESFFQGLLSERLFTFEKKIYDPEPFSKKGYCVVLQTKIMKVQTFDLNAQI